MPEAEAAAALRDALFVALKLGGPPLLAALVIGLAVSLFQAVTQVNEATLSFVPKVVVLGGLLALLGPFMMTTLSDYTHTLADRLITVGGR